MHAAGVNLLDSKIRNGEFKRILPYRLPLILGHDIAGNVVRVGSQVRRFTPGDEVYARPADGRIGAFAEFIATTEDDVAIKPKALTMEEAASIPLVGLTAWQALIERANLKRGQKVLIHAGSGGVGTFAIQLAKHVGATVATTTSTANVDLVKSLGADVVIDYKKDDFSHVLREYDTVLNSLDKVTLEKSLRVLKPGGQLISISGPPDAAFARSLKCRLGSENDHGRLELRDQSESQTPPSALLVSFHESERRTVGRDHTSHRWRIHSASRGSSFPLRIDNGGYGLRRIRTRQRQGRGHTEVRRGASGQSGARDIQTLSSFGVGENALAGIVLGYGGIARTNIQERLRRLGKCFGQLEPGGTTTPLQLGRPISSR